MVALAWFSVFHPRTVLILTAGITIWAAILASHLSLSTNIEDLLPRNVRSAQLVKGLLHRYGAAEPVVIAISGKGDADLDDRVDLALALKDRLSRNPHLHPVTGLFGEDPWALLDGPIARGLLMYLTPADMDQVAARVQPDAIRRRVRENLERLRSPLGPLLTELMREDPLGFSTLALRRLGALKGRLELGAREGVLVTDDGAYALLLVRPDGPSSDVKFARLIVGEIEAAAKDALASLGQAGTVGIGPPPPGAAAGDVHVGLTGSPAILLNYRSMLANDAGRISIVSYVAQLLLFLWAFRRGGALLVAGSSMLVGAIWALGFADLAIGEINVFTAGSIGILCGLTIDFSVHIYNRYLEEVGAGRDMLKAFRASHGETGLGILASVGVMVWAFAAGGWSEFRGLKDLAVICGAGLALSLLACLVMVPALNALATRVRRGREKSPRMADFGLAPVLGFVFRRPRTTVVLVLAATALLVLPALRMRLDEDVSRYQPRQAPAIRLQTDLITRSGASLQPVLALTPGASDEEIIERTAHLARAFDEEAHRPDGSLSAVLGPAQVVPPLTEQERTLARLRELRASGVIDPAGAERTLLAALEESGFKVDETAQRAAARVRELLARDQPLTVDEVRRSALGIVVDDLLVTNASGQRLGIVSAYPRPLVSSNVIVPALRSAVARSGVSAQLVGARVISQEVRPLILRDGLRASLIAAAGVLVILFLSFRRAVLVALTVLPLAVGLVAAVGAMSLLRIDFNLITISVLPLVIGIAIDNGIHIVHRFQEGAKHDIGDVMRHVGRGVVMASLTTIVGFAALLTADYPGLRSSGVLAMLATGATMVAALTLLPALLVLLEERRGSSRPS